MKYKTFRIMSAAVVGACIAYMYKHGLSFAVLAVAFGALAPWVAVQYIASKTNK